MQTTQSANFLEKHEAHKASESLRPWAVIDLREGRVIARFRFSPLAQVFWRGMGQVDAGNRARYCVIHKPLPSYKDETPDDLDGDDLDGSEY